VLTGGSGNDTFVYAKFEDSRPGKPDHITDFTPGADKIDLSALDAVKGGADNAFTFSDTAPTAGHGAGMVWFDAASHTLYASNDDGSGAEFAIVLEGVSAVTAADLVL
jgi:Ca2+-binding RTX toxin-like protein